MRGIVEPNPKGPPLGPNLVFEEREFPCGYAPRSIFLDPEEDVLFVGCKDGSLTVVRPRTGSDDVSRQDDDTVPSLEGYDHDPLPLGSEKRPAGVRTLCALEGGQLLVGRDDGTVERRQWASGSDAPEPIIGRETIRRLARELEPDSRFTPIRSIVRNPAGGVLVSIRSLGLFALSEDDLRELSGERLRELHLGHEPFDVRYALPLQVPDGGSAWLLLTEACQLYSWSGSLDESPSKVQQPRMGGNPPGVVSDYALIRTEEERKEGKGARGVLFATDSAVYLVEPRQDQETGDWRLAMERMVLPGLGRMATALSYSEDSNYCYLWAADSRGDSHLFWAHIPRRESEADPERSPIFRSSGVLQTQTEVLVCFLWTRSRSGPPDLFFAQARRNDRIVLGRYWDPRPSSRSATSSGERIQALETRIRYLLNHGRWMSGETSDRRSILLGALQELAGKEERLSYDDEVAWPEHALMAELFERLGEEEPFRKLLLDSIRSPHAKIPRDLLEESSEIEPSKARDISRLWTRALLGVIHRSGGLRQIAYLALLRWLRQRQQEAESNGRKELARWLQEDIGFARKWGLDGAANADRQDLVTPARILREQEEALKDAAPKDGAPPPPLDRLSYEALLFHRSVSLIEREDEGRRRGRTAWDLSTRRFGEHRLAAVSWMWGGVELYELGRHTADSGKRLVNPPAVLPSEETVDDELHDLGSRDSREIRAENRPSNWRDLGPRVSREIRAEKWGYSRVAHLGELDGRPYVVTAPTHERESAAEELHLWALRPGPEADRPWQARFEARMSLGQRESVYSLHELEEGCLIAGLRGAGGTAKIALLSLVSAGPGERLGWKGGTVEEQRLDPQPSEGTKRASFPEPHPLQNRVWSLTSEKLPEPTSAGDGRRETGERVFRVLAGCESGQVYRFRVRRSGEELELDRDSIERLPGRLGSPVLSLAYREEGLEYSRVYTGCEDGSLVAWQELPERESGGRFATLWSTQENGPVAGLHLVPFERGGKRLSRALLAITRVGRCVLLDDRAEVEHADEVEDADRSPRPSRSPVPGSRFGRFALFDTALASAVWTGDQSLGLSEESVRLGAYATLLSASGEGTVSLVSLHTPAKTMLRKGRYRDVLNLWGEAMRWEDWRLGEAIFRSAPILSLIIVRWLLDPLFEEHAMPDGGRRESREAPASEDGGGFPWPDPTDESFLAHRLPRHLRPLLEARRAWEALWTAENPEVVAESVGRCLEAALRRAWLLDDLDVFQEICALALKRANFDVYRLLRKKQDATWSERKIRMESLYSEVYEAIERSLQRWLGAPGRREARARMVVAKHMVDGDTALYVLREAARERRAAAGEGGGRDIAGRDLGPMEKILRRRITGVRELVHKRDPLVSLESLRAANLSLTRLCKRLTAERGPQASEWQPRDSKSPDDREIHWPVFAAYFERLTAAAVRTFQARRELSDAMAHEYSRTFALAICACPSATIRIANRLTETRLIRELGAEDDLSERVVRQLDVLGQIGIPAPAWARRLFRAVTRVPGPAAGMNPVSRKALEEEGLDLEPLPVAGAKGAEERVEGWIRGTRSEVGVQNTEDLHCLYLLYEVVGWFTDLTRRLATDAQEIDLSAAAFDRLRDLLEEANRPHGPSGGDLYQESVDFWLDCVEELTETLHGAPKRLGETPEADGRGPSAAGRDVRPESVLLSAEIADWAKGRIQELERRGKERHLFLPELTLFRQVLSELERSAREFRRSAAVQKNIVRGVLGHHLLEDLDEHVLELAEMAQALDPVRAEELRNAPGPDGGPEGKGEDSTARRFASYLVRRARAAESIPKNLRVLQTLLSSPAVGEAGDERDSFRSKQLLSPFGSSAVPEPFRWNLTELRLRSNDSLPLSQDELSFLRLTLEELSQNQRKHSGLRRAGQSCPRVEALPGETGAGLVLTFPFCMKAGDEERTDSNFGRLKQLSEVGLQELLDPRPRFGGASTGTGLYLANLAAAVVRWQLAIEKPEEPAAVDHPEPDCRVAWCRFTLARLPESGSREEKAP